MTYEDVLEKLDSQIAGLKMMGCKCTSCVSTIALRSVVSLHSPEGKPTSQCRTCKRFFPCYTIQAIMKELE